MSGSKHSTWRELKRSMDNEKNTEIDRAEAVKRTNTIYRELKSKHYIKKKTLKLRRMRKAGEPIDNMPNSKFYRYDVMPMERSYKVEEENFEGMLLPLSQKDINEIASVLPSSMTFKLGQIKLTQNEFEKEEILPGVWRSVILGTAFIGRDRINLYGYKIDRDKHSFKEPLEFYLKVLAMGTLIHEIAHHYDFTLTYSRKGRYKDTKELGLEEYAKHVERDFYLGKVCRYIKQEYCMEYIEFKKWMSDMGCLPLEVEYFDPGLCKNPGYYLLSNFFWGICEGKNAVELNLILAQDLYDVEEIKAAQEYIDHVLKIEPSNIEAERLNKKISQLKVKQH